MHEKQQGGGHPLCPQSHDSTEGMGGGAGVQGNQWMKKKINRRKTAVVDPYVTPGLALITADLLHKIKSQVSLLIS